MSIRKISFLLLTVLCVGCGTTTAEVPIEKPKETVETVSAEKEPTEEEKPIAEEAVEEKEEASSKELTEEEKSIISDMLTSFNASTVYEERNPTIIPGADDSVIVTYTIPIEEFAKAYNISEEEIDWQFERSLLFDTTFDILKETDGLEFGDMLIEVQDENKRLYAVKRLWK